MHRKDNGASGKTKRRQVVQNGGKESLTLESVFDAKMPKAKHRIKTPRIDADGMQDLSSGLRSNSQNSSGRYGISLVKIRGSKLTNIYMSKINV